MLSAITASCLTLSLMADIEAGVAGNRIERDPHAWLTKHPTITRLLKLQNEERQRYGLAPLKLNVKMCLAAQKHATWMSETGYYMHSNLPWPEMIHSGPLTPDGAVSGWIYSPAHHSIMLSGTQAGFGYAKRNGATYWVTVIQ